MTVIANRRSCDIIRFRHSTSRIFPTMIENIPIGLSQVVIKVTIFIITSKIAEKKLTTTCPFSPIVLSTEPFLSG